MVKNLILFFTAITICNLSFAQIDKKYHPLVFEGQLPNELTIDYSKQLAESIEAEKELNPKEAMAFYSSLYSFKRSIFQNGNIYYNNVLTSYVQSVTDELLKNQPELHSKIKVYVTRYSSSNAMTLSDGSIFINVGLLAVMENEAQLAFILGHEIAHFEKRHAIKELMRLKQVQKQDKQAYYDTDLFRGLQYSRENESEADSRGLQILINSNYDAREGIKALGILQDTVFNYPTLTTTLISTFTSETLKIDSNFFANKNTGLTNNNKNNIVFGSISDDLYSTHPDMDKRISAMREMLKIVDYNFSNKAKNVLFDEDKTKMIKEISFLEMIENLYMQTDFNISIYLSLGTLNKCQECDYLKLMLIKNLYWLSYYKELNNIEKTFNHQVIEETSSLKSLNKFFETISHNDLKKISFEYAKQQLDSQKSSDEYFLYYALISEMYLGKEPGKLIYNQYLLKFPDSKYAAFVNQKVK
jgi:Zn-dependent protease with chaperone function